MNVLEEAGKVIYGDREKTYGSPSKCLDLIAQYWSGHIGVPITAVDVCIMMTLLKLARLQNQPNHRDSLVDAAGYVALVERISDV